MNNKTLRAFLRYANAAVFAQHCTTEALNAIINNATTRETYLALLNLNDAQRILTAAKSHMEHAILDQATPDEDLGRDGTNE